MKPIRYTVGTNILWELLERKINQNPHQKIGLITDTNLMELYKEPLHSLSQKNFYMYSFAAGEASKSRHTKACIEDFLIEHGFDRHSLLIAFGGGIVGDVVGFVAATFYRGIFYIQVPTTLLAMVDAGLGGKTGLNVHGIKNLIGAFHPAVETWIDMNVLDTLPLEEYRYGLAEVIKYGLILDERLYETLKNEVDNIMARKKNFISIGDTTMSCL